MRTQRKLFYGDTHGIRVRRKNLDGTIPDVAGSTSIKLLFVASNGEEGEITGAIDAPSTDGTYLFAAASTAVDPGKGKTVYLDCVLQWTSGGNDYNANEKIRFAIEKFS